VSEAISNIDGSVFQIQPTPRLTPGALKRARAMLGLSQADLSRLVGLTCTAISQFETGRTHLRPKNEVRVIAAFVERGVDVAGGGIRLRPPRLVAAE
jgi:transcriptional regulator with XRE-family HTH domain